VFLSKKEISNKRKIILPSDDEEEPSSPIRKKIAVSTSKSSAPKPRPSTGKKKHQADEDFDMASPQHSSSSEADDPFIEDDDIKPQKSKSKTSTKKPPVANSSKTKTSTSKPANGTNKSQDAPKPNKFEYVSFFFSIFVHNLYTFVAGLPKRQHSWQAPLPVVLKKSLMAHQIALLAFHSFLQGN
jgi:hypothetical protein